MKYQGLAITLATSFVGIVWAGPDDGNRVGQPEQNRTRISISALANVKEPAAFVRESDAGPTKPGVRQMANQGIPRDPKLEKSESRRGPDRRTTESDRAVKQRASGRGDGISDQPDYTRFDMDEQRNDRRVNGARDRASRQDRAWTGNPWAANMWDGMPFSGFGGFGGNGFGSGQVVGYRSFRYPYSFNNSYLVPGYYGSGYYGFGLTPVAFGISGPVTTHYEDPWGRQRKLVQDGIENFAAPPRRVTNP